MRTVIKHSYLKATDAGLYRARRHLRYLAFRSVEKERSFFDNERPVVSRKEVEACLARHASKSGVVMHKLVLSPGANFEDMQSYVREIMANISSVKGLDLEWFGVIHKNTDHWHVHVLVMPKDKRGYSVRFDKADYREIKIAGDRFLWRNNLLERKKYYERRRFARNPHRALHGLKQRVHARLSRRAKELQKRDHSRLRLKRKAIVERKHDKHQGPKARQRFCNWLRLGIGRCRQKNKSVVNDKELKRLLEHTFRIDEKGEFTS